MIYNYKIKINRQKGAAMLVSILFFSFISLATISGLVAPSVREFKTANNFISSHQSYFLSESVLEDSFYRLKNGLTIGQTNTITLNGNSATASISDSDYNEKTISALGDVSLRQRKTEMVLSTGTGIAFNFGVQVGSGGLTMGNNSVINGSVYSNGPITGSGVITGSATSANSSALVAEEFNGIEANEHIYTIAFGRSYGDIAQSFFIDNNDVINKVEFYMKKSGTPGSNVPVYITTDNNGKPSTTILASGTLSPNNVPSNYGWVSITLTSNPELAASTTYWIVINTSSSSNYYSMASNYLGNLNGLTDIGQYGGTWAPTSPKLDAIFRVYFGGIKGSINGITIGSGGVGNAYANSVTNSNIAGTNYCQTGSGNNKSCNTSLADPVQIAMPISDQNILDWKADAESGGVYNGNYTVNSTSASLGPKKIVGNLTVTNNAQLTITGTLWVTGTVSVSNNAVVRLSPSYGSSEGLIIADGTITIGNNSTFSGSGSSGSYLMVLSTSTSTSAITLDNNGGAVVLYAANGTVNLSNNAGAKALNGKYIYLNNNAVVTYDSGLANANFVNGPSGGWSVSSWKEVE